MSAASTRPTAAEGLSPELAERFGPLLAEISAGAVGRERDRELPWAAVRSLREAGFGALRLPREAGGSGLGLADFFALLVELARADSNLPQLWRGHIAFVEHVLSLPAGESKERWLERLAAGEIVGNAQSEPGGSAFWRPETRIERSGEGWVVEGRKFYSTGSIFADWIYTSGADGEDHVSALVRADGSGVERIDDWDGFGQRLTGSGTTIFERAAAEEVTVHPRGERPSTTQNAVFQLVLLATLAGIGQRALDEALDFVRGRSRSAFTARVAVPSEDPQVHQVLGELAGLVLAARSSVQAVARTLEEVRELEIAGSASAVDVARAEVAVFTAQGVVVDLVLRATTDVFRVGGASATAEHRALDRHWRNARTVSSHNPEIFRAATVGKALLDGTSPHDQLAAAVAAQISQGVPA